MQKVTVRPGPRLGPDGKPPRLGVPDRDGRELPGRYLFHDVKNPGPDSVEGRPNGEPTEFVYVERDEDVYDTPLKREEIRQGFLLVVDPRHELAVFNVTPPEPPPEADPPKKKNAARKHRKKRTASED